MIWSWSVGGIRCSLEYGYLGRGRGACSLPDIYSFFFCEGAAVDETERIFIYPAVKALVILSNFVSETARRPEVG